MFIPVEIQARILSLLSLNQKSLPEDVFTSRSEYPLHEISHYAIIPDKIIKSRGKKGIHDHIINGCRRFEKTSRQALDARRENKGKSMIQAGSIREELFFPFILEPNESGVLAYEEELNQVLELNLPTKDYGWTGGRSQFQLWMFGCKPTLKLFRPTIAYVSDIKNHNIDCFHLGKKIDSFSYLNLKDMVVFHLWLYYICSLVFDRTFTDLWNKQQWCDRLFPIRELT